ncbi:MAG: hypothetical protein IJ716_09540 [Lachnospiraceae bacterium]|nr:hypothetical protein [Lachnospiraceae bacterium]
METECYNKFPKVLRDALRNEKVMFPQTLRWEYEDMAVYRGIRYTKQKSFVDKSDFCSNIERHLANSMVPADDHDIGSYSCSCFMDIDQLRLIANFPRKNYAIAKGMIKKEFGPIDVNDETSHVHLFLYENVDPSGEFEVIEKWEQNG